MQFVAFVLAYPLLWIISRLPFSILYKFSDLIYFLVYHVIGYRKKTVRYNINHTLTHLSNSEKLEVEKKFFRHMCDMFLEMIKTMGMTEEEMKKRFVITNIDLIKSYEAQGKSVALMCAHYASWEWLITIANQINFKSIAIYKKINNKYFDQLIRDIRHQLNAELVETKKTIDLIEKNEAAGIKAFYGFASDQSPQLHRARYWDQFMGHEVPVYTGAEMIAKRFDFNMVFIKVKKVKRGFYEATIVPLVDNPKDYPDYQVTSIFLREVEKQILEAPEYYFWTHKRWKHEGKKPTVQTN